MCSIDRFENNKNARLLIYIFNDIIFSNKRAIFKNNSLAEKNYYL